MTMPIQPPPAAMKQTFSPLGSPEFMLVEDKLQAVICKADGLIQQTCLSFLHSGGKRVRPLLTLYSGMCFSHLNPLLLQAAVAVELIHMASLIHDDILDKSTRRRGSPTVNALYGNHAAVLTGDYLFAEAFNILASPQLLPSMTYFIAAIQSMCEGEVDQGNEQFSSALDQEDYYRRIAKKTGRLLTACCQAGSSLTDASPEQISQMGRYGLNIGYAYQITDDILDIDGSSSDLGKPVGADLLNGNITLPLLYLLEHPIHGDWLKEIMETRNLSYKVRQQVKEALISSGCLAQAREAAAQCIGEARNCLAEIPDSPYRSALLDLAVTILRRTS